MGKIAKLIVVAGPPASGKSTFARRLSDALRVPLFDKDTHNEIIGVHLPIETEEARRMLSAVSVKLVLHAADKVLSAGGAAIVEANFKPDERPLFDVLLEKNACRAMTYLFTGEMEALYARFARREKSPARHPIHKRHAFADAGAFADAVLPLATFQVGELCVRVDTTDFARVDFGTLAEKARLFLCT